MSQIVDCTQCGRPVDLDDDMVCPHCGAEASPVTPRRATPPPPPAEVATVVAGATAAVGDWRCGTAGCPPESLTAELDACPYCGASRPAAPAVPQALGASSVLRALGADATVVLTGEGPWTIGRLQPGSPELVQFDSVSGTHAEIRRHEGTLLVRDLCSTNGTSVDQVALDGPDDEHILYPGSILSLGPEVHLRHDRT
ncbi:MAG: FHA domain-containing protein [Solirubrobacteraceae bacterium]|nr:FHA domain-containing protein [Patulibacter sp.]